MKHFLLSFLFCATTLLAQKPKNYSAVTDELTQKIVAASASAQPVRLAVVPFSATKSSTQSSAQFGEYITETIIGLLAGHPDKIKLFERTRMDAILKEQEFILTDLMKPAAALKIGQLVPIDALLSGTYTKLKSYIDVSARLIDVASGEITVSFNGRIKMNKNLAALFQETENSNPVVNPVSTSNPAQVNVTVNNTINTSGNPAKSKAEICKEKVEEFNTRLHDLSSPEKIESVVTEAIKTPFDNSCGQLHYNVMYSFSRFKIENQQYKNFILQTLDTIAYPAGDERAYEIVQFLSSDNLVDDKEWRAGLDAISRVGNYSLSTYLNYLIARPNEPGQETVQSRITAYFSLASNGKIGLPRPVSFEVAFFEMVEGIKNNQPLRQHVYENYSRNLNLGDKSKATMFSTLHSIYKEEKESARKTEIMNWVIDFVNANEYEKAPEQLYDFARGFELTLNEQRNEEIKREYPENDLKILTVKCRDKFSKFALLSPYSSQREDRINFCVKYEIPVPGVVPTMDEADAILKGNILDEQLRVMKLLVLMNERPKKIESTIVSLFSKRSLEDRGKLEEIQTLAITVLGNCQTSNTKAIEFMIAALPHYGNDTEAAKEALSKIGKPAVPLLINRLDKTTDQDGGLQYQLIVLLGKIGKDAAIAEKSINRILSVTRNSDVKYAAEAALQAIR